MISPSSTLYHSNEHWSGTRRIRTLVHIHRLYHLCQRLHWGRNHFPHWQGSRCYEQTLQSAMETPLHLPTDSIVLRSPLCCCMALRHGTWPSVTAIDGMPLTWAVKWYHHVRNSTIRQQTKQRPVSNTLTQRRLRWFDHLQRMPTESEVLHNFSPGTIGWTRPRDIYAG